jgi:hypothetical protein
MNMPRAKDKKIVMVFKILDRDEERDETKNV